VVTSLFGLQAGNIAFTAHTCQQTASMPAGAHNEAQQQYPNNQGRQVENRVDEQGVEPAPVQPTAPPPPINISTQINIRSMA
jgi:hypothetical protein